MEKSITAKKGRIPRPILLFFVKATVLFLLWKVAYLGFLSPHRTLDEPLTYSVGQSTAVLLNIFSHGFSAVESEATIEMEGGSSTGNVMDIYRNGHTTLRIADACNGLELFALYLGFIICFPASTRKKIKFAAIGIALIYALNVIRCAALVGIFLHYNKYLDFSHHFAFTFIVYGFIFMLWYFFTKTPAKHARAV